MTSRRGVWIGCALALVLSAEFGFAQTLPQTTENALHAMSQLAGVIFAGQVAAVRRHKGTGGTTGVVEIDFAVEDAVRGVSGGRYTLREWAGLWPAGDEPFRVGQQFLMLLHAPGAAGLSSPVGGMDGAIPIRGGSVAAGRTQTDGLIVDLRWVQTGVVRALPYRVEPMGQPTARPTLGHLASENELSANTGEAESVPISRAAIAGRSMTSEDTATASNMQGESYATTLRMLRSWVKGDHGSR